MTPQDRAPQRIAIIAIIALFIVFLLAGWLARFATDYMWFIDLGQRDVFVTMLASRIVVGLAFAVVAFLLLYSNMRIARSMAPRAVLTSVGNIPPQIAEIVVTLRTRFSSVLDKVVLGVSLFVAFVAGVSMSSYWAEMRLALAGVSFGETDPQFGRDIGFYVFTLPALRIVADWVLGMLVFATVITAVVHVLDGSIQPWARLKGFAPHVKAHLSVLLGLIVASKAFDYYLDVYELNFSPRGQVTGASYTDVNAQLPALRILIAIAAISAAILLYNIRAKGWGPPLVALGVWVGASFIVGTLYPAAVQQFRVAPNEIAAEAPYIERNISATRRGFALDEVETRQFPAAETLSVDDVIANRDTLQNVRLWDPDIVPQSYRQLQVIRPYYDFYDVDVDRYKLDGELQQVLVSAREMNGDLLAETAQTWLNRHLVYTHGYGVVMSPVNASDRRGYPDFVLRDIPPLGDSPELKLDQPAIYFGEETVDYVIVNTEQPEFDYPVGEADQENAETLYEGAAGVKVSNLLGRMAFALRFGSSQILLSPLIDGESRVLFDRDIRTRVGKLAPWLELDADPYPIVVNGRVMWVLDGYTWSDRYPYSEPSGGISYVRNSVKVTVDAYDGTTTFYAVDETDPILQAWRSIFPDLVHDGSEVPTEVREHFRYPEGLFMTQAGVYRTYHMTDPRVFYNKEDSWEIPGERGPSPMSAFYVLMRLPGEQTEDFQMIMPFTPRNRDNMIGWMAAKSDPNEYGKRVVYRFPKQRVILGPEQVSARVNQDEVISPQISLWSQRGSQVLFGNMLVIPLEESIVYIQPLYLQAEQAAIPELTRVIVVYADKVEMAPDLEAALLAVFGEEAPTDAGTPPSDGAEVSAEQAQELYRQALEAQKAGDWAAYGSLIQELGAVLDELAGDGSVEATPTP
ncbi:MAG: UPF0182 family protein [Coriobacteriia bacterium]|nr:UPF0182 family protein [Coriobacteriia bacterium]